MIVGDACPFAPPSSKPSSTFTPNLEPPTSPPSPIDPDPTPTLVGKPDTKLVAPRILDVALLRARIHWERLWS